MDYYLSILGFDPADDDKQMPFTHVFSPKTESHTGSKLYVMSMDYPRLMSTSMESMCVITLPMNSFGTVKFLDMTYISTEQPQCPIRVDIPGNFSCADSETYNYGDLHLSPAKHQRNLPHYDVHLTVIKNVQVREMRLWLEISGKYH